MEWTLWYGPGDKEAGVMGEDRGGDKETCSDEVFGGGTSGGPVDDVGMGFTSVDPVREAVTTDYGRGGGIEGYSID